MADTLGFVKSQQIDPQQSSPLFITLPAEIRSRIFDFALTPYTLKHHSYASDQYWYRPFFRYGDIHVWTPLLLTCRRIYIEAAHLPYENSVHVAWFYRGPKDDSGQDASQSEQITNSDEYFDFLEALDNDQVVDPIPDADPHPDTPQSSSTYTPITNITNLVAPPLPATAAALSATLNHSKKRHQPPIHHPKLLHLHLFTQQFWLESWCPSSTTQQQDTQPHIHSYVHTPTYTLPYHPAVLSTHCPNLQSIRLTIRHTDWWWWETAHPLALDPGQVGQPYLPWRRGGVSGSGVGSGSNHDDGSGFANGSWGRGFTHFANLRRLVLELETVEEKMEELDGIALRAAGWRFPLSSSSKGGSSIKSGHRVGDGDGDGDGNVVGDGDREEETMTRRALVLNPQLTKRRGWMGRWINEEDHGDRDPVAARKRLEKHGVDFEVEDGEAELEREEDMLVYYVVTLVFEARDLPA